MGNTTSIFITSDNSEDFKYILDSLNSQNGLNIIDVENDETNTIIKSERLKPDVLILDLTQPVIDGTELAPIIHRRSPDTAIIMICDKEENEYAGKALKAGILGFLLRNEDMNKILPAVIIVSLGGYYISASITIKAINTITLVKKFPGQFLENKENYPVFSSTERNIVEYIAKGFTDDEIACYLHLSTGTIRNYITAIKHKTKQKNRIQTVIFSLVHGLISIEQMGFMG
ncbi:MAG: response regulator transcription factor [Treponema sp.]|jgi:two-component system response regulator NreC|nr:response regulator transcription factor [Treponema sp.]